MRSELTETTLKWIGLKAAAEAAGEAQAAAAAGDGGASDTPASKGSVTPAGGRADAFESSNRNRVMRGLPPISYQEFISGTGRSTSQLQIMRTPVRAFAKGGKVSSGSVNQNFGFPEGHIPAPRQEGVPTLLHGGEYILNAKAVSRIGIGALNKMNNNLLPKFAKGGVVPGGKNKKSDGTLNGPYGTVVKPVIPGNINLSSLPAVKNNIKGEGGVSTVRSLSIGTDRGVMLIPTVVNGKILSDQSAINYAISKNKNLGTYKDNAAAEMAAQIIHMSEANRIGKLNPSNTRGSADRLEASSVARISQAQNQRNADLKNAGIAKNFIGPIAPKPKDEGIFGKIGNFAKELARPKNSFAMIGGAIGTALGATGAGVGAVPGGVIGAGIGGALGSFTEQIFDKVKGFQPLDIAKNAAIQSAFQLGGVALAKVGSSVVKPALMSRFPGVGTYLESKIIKPVIDLFKKPSAASSGLAAANRSSMALELYRGPLQAQTVTKEAYQDADALITESFEMYKIGLENVGFGIPRKSAGFDVPSNFKNIDLNPYDISGLSPMSKSGQKTAKDWILAHIAYAETTGNAQTNFIDALLYAGKRGDINSMLQFNQYAQSGRNLMNKARSAKPFNRFALSQDAKNEVIQRQGLENFSLDDLFLVHETKFPPPLDKFGNISLRPTADYQSVFSQEGVSTELIRDTVHFAVNHLVKGHSQRPNIPNAHIIVSRLKDVLDANPGALDNLYAVDTWLTPKPGQGLTIPKGSFEHIFDSSNPRQSVQNAMTNMLGSKFSSRHLFAGGEYNSESPGVDFLLQEIAGNLGATSGVHTGTMSHLIESSSIKELQLSPASNFKASFSSHLSDNAIARLFSRSGLFSGVKKTIEYPLSPLKTGGYIPGSPSTPFPALLHGGEYVVNADAVRNMGVRTMQSINQSKFRTPSSAPSYMGGGQTTNVSTVNINVDTFVGEEEWFKSMMKSYNVNVLPKQQKAAGMETRTFTSYNGINQGL